MFQYFIYWGGSFSLKLSSFPQKTFYRPYLQNVIDNFNARMKCTDFISSMSIFDPRHLPSSEREQSNYGMEKLRVLTSF